MKIALLSLTSGQVNRGMETVVDELALRWSKHHQVTVYQAGNTVNHKDSYLTQVVPITINWEKYFQPNNLDNFMLGYNHDVVSKFTTMVLNLLDTNHPDLIIPTNGGRQSLQCRLWTNKRHIPMVISGQAGLGWCDGWNLLVHPDAFIAVSERNRKWAQQLYGRTVRIEVIPNGVDLDEYSINGKNVKFNLPSPLILCVAGWNRYKRVKETIDAAAQLANGSLLVVGGSDETMRYGQLIMGNRFLQTQFKHEEMPAVYRAADVFTLVSESSEAFGIAYIEALASGLPIVATNDELRHELLRDRALYITDPTNSSTYCELLQQALRLGRRDPPQWIKEYSWDAIAQQYENLLAKLV